MGKGFKKIKRALKNWGRALKKIAFKARGNGEVSVARSLARSPKGLETKTRKREKRNRNQLGFVFPIKNGLAPALFALDVGLDCKKCKGFLGKSYIFQSALKKLVIFLAPASGRLSENHKLFKSILKNV